MLMYWTYLLHKR